MRRAFVVLGWLVIAGVASGCIAPEGGALEAPGSHADVAEANLAAGPDTSKSRNEPGVLPTVQSVPVVLPDTFGQPFEVALRTRELPTGHTRRFGSVAMRVALRTESVGLTQYPCTSCHLGVRVVMADDRIGDAHQNIKPVHPKATGAVCSTCHAAENVERLVVKSNNRPSLDHSYRVCATCHFRQVEAWAGGGHGKRLDGWQGRRIVMGCTDCHDPHAPALAPRVPFRGPTLPASQGHE